MEPIILTVVTIAVFCFFSGAERQGMMCLNCNDVSSPKHCQDVTICGRAEICSTHEFIDYKGLRGYRLGCEDRQTCELVHQAKALFGKRDDRNTHPVPHYRCYGCCSTDECNRELCQTDSRNYSQAGVQPTVTSQGMICKSCQGVESPEHCRQTTVCGDNEICFTREYTDHGGLKGFRMGCESQTRCSLFLNAASLFGKRHLPEPAPPEGCYDCCSSDECNTGLCRGSTGGYSHGSTTTSQISQTTITLATSTSSTPQTTTVKIKGCPYSFIPFKDSCYLFDPKPTAWPSARSYCQRLGSDLISLHSEEEHQFIAQQLKTLNVQTLDSYWTAGFYNQSTREYAWADGTPMDYTSWVPGAPSSSHTDKHPWYILLGNPVYVSSYYNTPFWEWGAATEMGTICKMKKR